MNTTQHISMFMERLISVLLPGGRLHEWGFGSWHLGRFVDRVYAELNAKSGHAGLVTIPVTKRPAMRYRVANCAARKA